MSTALDPLARLDAEYKARQRLLSKAKLPIRPAPTSDTQKQIAICIDCPNEFVRNSEREGTKRCEPCRAKARAVREARKPDDRLQRMDDQNVARRPRPKRSKARQQLPPTGDAVTRLEAHDATQEPENSNARAYKKFGSRNEQMAFIRSLLGAERQPYQSHKKRLRNSVKPQQEAQSPVEVEA